MNPNPLRRSEPDSGLGAFTRQALIDGLAQLAFELPRPIPHPRLPELPDHLPVLVQGYSEPLDLPWVALHGARLFGETGAGLTPKHRRLPLRDVYRLSPRTRIAIEFNVDDRVLEGFWRYRATTIPELLTLHADLVLTPNYSCWRDAGRTEHVRAQLRALATYRLFAESGVMAVPDVSFASFEAGGQLWADWVNRQDGLQAVSLYCGGKKVHASGQALRETLDDVRLFHKAVRPEVAFVIGGVHAPRRMAAYRDAAPGRRLTFLNSMAYGSAQRRRLLGQSPEVAVDLAPHDCFVLNARTADNAYARLLRGGGD